MTAAVTSSPDDGRALGSAAEILAALIPEEARQFQAEWTEEMARAAKTLDLTPVLDLLASWRVVARHTTAHGAEAHRRMYRRAAERLGGAPIPGDEPLATTKQRLGL